MMTEKKNLPFRILAGKPLPLGIQIDKDRVNFAVSAKDGSSCALLLYPKENPGAPLEIPFPQDSRVGDVSCLTLEGLNVREYDYNFQIGGRVVLDPYARLILGREKWGVREKTDQENTLRCGFPADDYEWEGDTPLEIPYSELVMYSLHVRDFTMHASSGIPHPGTFQGITEKIPYLKELGINHLELMPAYEFDELPSRRPANPYAQQSSDPEKIKWNTWGYGPGYYFAPKAAYASGADPMREFKDMVKHLHRNGMEVSMEFYFPKGTLCELMVRCLRYWVLEYHIDGIHLSGEAVPAEILAADPLLAKTKLMGQGFAQVDFSWDGQTSSFRNLAEYNDGFLNDARRFLKGDEDMTGAMAARMRKNPSGQAVINYITGHNGFTLRDLVSYDGKHNESNGEENRDGPDYNFSWNCGAEGPSRKKAVTELRNRQIRNALAFLMLSQGTPMLLFGDERGHTKGGNNNSYCQDNEISWISWRKNKQGEEIYQYLKKLIAFRKSHPILHMQRELRIMDYLSCGYPDLSYHGKKAWFGEFETYSRQLGMMLCGKYVKADGKSREDDFLYLAFNMHWIEHEFALPRLPRGKKWKIALDTGMPKDDGFYEPEWEPVLEQQKSCVVRPRTVMVLIGK